MCGLISGWGGNVGVALIMRMLISFNVDDERALTRRVGAMLVDSLSLSHTHTYTRTQTHSATDVRQAAAPILNTHTYTDRRQPFWHPHPFSTCASLSYPQPPTPLPVLSLCLHCWKWLHWKCCLLFYLVLLCCLFLLCSSSPLLPSFCLARFSFILYFYTIKYTWRGVSV